MTREYEKEYEKVNQSQAIRQPTMPLGPATRLYLLAAVVLSLWVPRAFAHNCCCIQSASISKVCQPNLFLPTVIVVTVEGVYRKDLECGGPSIRIRFVDCEDKTIETSTWTFGETTGHEGDDTGSPGPQPFTVSRSYYISQGRFPEKIILEKQAGEGSTGDCPDEYSCDDSSWHYVDEVAGCTPEATCGIPVAELEAGLLVHQCKEPAYIEDSNLKVYKSHSNSSCTLYALPLCDPSNDKQWGEVVNGEFIAPSSGILVVEVHGQAEANSSMKAVDIYGSEDPNDPGWYDPILRRQNFSIPLMDDTLYCHTMNAGDKFKFNVMAWRTDTSKIVTVRFRWGFPWNSDTCCLDYAERTLVFAVRPFVADLVAADPVMPTLHPWTKSDGSTDWEIRLPNCATCANSPGQSCNLSRPFMFAPTSTGKRAKFGHAKGWKVKYADRTLVSPGPEAIEYPFEVIP